MKGRPAVSRGGLFAFQARFCAAERNKADTLGATTGLPPLACSQNGKMP